MFSRSGAIAAGVAIACGVGFFLLEKRAVEKWPPGGSFEQPETLQTDQGPVKLPILYFNGSGVGVFYLVDPVLAQELLPDNLEPMLLPLVKKAIAGVFLLDYKNTTIGPYGEMGLAIQARRKGSGATWIGYLYDMFAHVYKFPEMLKLFSSINTGLYMVTLPVETLVALEGRLLGYPKYESGFTINFTSPEAMSYTLGNEFTLKMRRPSYGVTMSGLPFLIYLDGLGSLYRVVIEVGHKALYGFSDVQLDIFGRGPSADKMKKLGLDKISPLASFRTDELKAHLPRGIPVDRP